MGGGQGAGQAQGGGFGGFMQNLNGLLSGGNPMFDLGIGLLANSSSMNFGDALSAAQDFSGRRSRGAMENQVFRTQMMDDQRKRAAMDGLRGLLAGDLPGDEPVSGGGLLAQGAEGGAESDISSKLLPLLFEIDPGAAIKLMTDGDDEDTSTLKEMKRLGYDLTAEGRRQYAKDTTRADSGSVLDSQKTQLEIAKIMHDLQKDKDETTKEKATSGEAIDVTLEKAAEYAQIVDELEGTVFQPGEHTGKIASGAEAYEQVMQVFGKGDPVRRANIDKHHRKKQLAKQIGLAGAQAMQGIPVRNQLEFETILTSFANPDVPPGTQRANLADLIEKSLATADATGHEVKDRAKWKAMAEDLRARSITEKKFLEKEPERKRAQNVVSGNKVIPPHHIERLRQMGNDPQAIKDFDEKYGPGAAKRVLNGG